MTSQKRARDPKAKEIRRESILLAARKLYEDSPQQLPTISAIAAKSGLAKGTIYLYFKSKEAIFLALLEQHYLAWLSLIERTLGLADVTAEQTIDIVCDYILQNPEFLRLAVISSSIIEHNIDRSDLMAYKNHISAQVKRSSKVLAQISDHSVEESTQLLMRSYALLMGLWQLSNPTGKIAEALNNPTLQMFRPDFALEAKLSLLQLWQGFFSRTQQQKQGIWRNFFG